MFNSLEIIAWRQFENVNLEFHPRLTLITGANGAGKTSLLNILNLHFGWTTQFVGTPKRDSNTGNLKFISDTWPKFVTSDDEISPHTENELIGSIIYSNGEKRNITVPNMVGAAYNVQIFNAVAQKGFFVPSHRPIFKYQPIQNIPTSVISKQNSYHAYNTTKSNRYNGAHVAHPELYYIKETLISLATFGYGNKVVAKNDEAIKLFEGFAGILKEVLPPKLGFESITIRVPEVILITKSGEFSLDAVSGGIASIIDLAWQIFMFDDNLNPYTITFDEPENHLHPEMQKTLLPNFLNAFPRAQFIIATHSPFIISSVADSNVYVLNYNYRNRVQSIKLDNIEKSGTANDILREVLGLETTMPDWVDDKIEEIIKRYSNSGITAENVQKFKSELKEVGLDKYVSSSIVSLIEKSKGND